MNKEKLEGYLINLGITYENVSDNTWVINDEDKGLERVVVAVEEPLVIIRVKVMDIPADNREKFYEKLLRLNNSDLIHGAYALETVK